MEGYTQAPTTQKGLKAKVKQMKKRNMLLIILVVVLAAVGGYFAYKYNQAQKDVERLSNPQASAKAQAKELTQEVGQLVQLPTSETPTVATVTDINKLKGQAFFAKAQNGDKVLIYTQAKRAYLYRPSTNKVLEIAPINFNKNPTKTSSGTSTQTQTNTKTGQ